MLTIGGEGVDEGYLWQELGPPMMQWQVVQGEFTSSKSVDLLGQKLPAGRAVYEVHYVIAR